MKPVSRDPMVDDLAAYLRGVDRIASANRSRCTQSFLLRRGRPFLPAPKREVREGGTVLRRGPMGRCFQNAYRVALRWPTELVYCEGYAAGPAFPVAHAWVARRSDGLALEPTWDVPAPAYVGVAVEAEDLMRIAARKRTYGLLDDWRAGWPVETGRERLSEVALPDAGVAW